jgi:tRNA modification GTPase
MPFDPSSSDTIAAVSTPVGVAGIGIVRISGPAAKNISRRVFRPKKPVADLKSHRLYFGYLHDPKTGNAVDEVLLSFMAAPRTYTREDVVEINTHSGIVLLSRILEIVIAEGARPAEPGEFTFRAFMNGRIDLSQAEGMMDLIHAQSEKGLRLAANHVKGALRTEVERIRQGLIDGLSRIEVLIDYPDEDPAVLPGTEEIEGSLIKPLRELIAAHSRRKIWIQGVKTAIVGRVNAGKSSLLNRLLDEERALVSSIPGTTRDVIESSLHIQGLPLRLMDTAGFRRGRGELEKKGMDRSRKEMEEAEFILVIVDRSRPVDDIDREILAQIRGRRTLVVLNKIDLPSRINETDLTDATAGLPLVEISALTGEGMDELRQAIHRLVLSEDSLSPDLLMAPNMRQKQALEKSLRMLVQASRNLQDAMPLEIVAEDMNEALAALGEISGETTTEEVLDRIFSTFCLGK